MELDFLKTCLTQSFSHVLTFRAAEDQLARNSSGIKLLLKIIILYGKEGLALRSHRDDQIERDSTTDRTCLNKENFVELIRFVLILTTFCGSACFRDPKMQRTLLNY